MDFLQTTITDFASTMAVNQFSTTASSSQLYGYVHAAKELKVDLKKQADKTAFYFRDKQIGWNKGTTSSLNSKDAARVCRNKIVTKRTLAAAGVKVPCGLKVVAEDMKAALEFAREREFQVVIKPADGRGGSGVNCSIATEAELITAFEEALKTSKSKQVIVEERGYGVDLRLIVVGGEVACASARLPAHVIGDGMSSVSILIDNKNRLREAHPHHRRFPVHASTDGQLIPKAGEIVMLSAVANIHQGGEAYDVTSQISADIKELAIKSASAVPGLRVAGVDIITTSFKDASAASVLELNSSPNFGLHYFPYRGSKQNPGHAVLNLMMSLALHK